MHTDHYGNYNKGAKTLSSLGFEVVPTCHVVWYKSRSQTACVDGFIEAIQTLCQSQPEGGALVEVYGRLPKKPENPHNEALQ